MKNLFANISYYNRFSSIFRIFWHLLITKKLMMSACNKQCQHFFFFSHTLNGLFKEIYYLTSLENHMKKLQTYFKFYFSGILYILANSNVPFTQTRTILLGSSIPPYVILRSFNLIDLTEYDKYSEYTWLETVDTK